MSLLDLRLHPEARLPCLKLVSEWLMPIWANATTVVLWLKEPSLQALASLLKGSSGFFNKADAQMRLHIYLPSSFDTNDFNLPKHHRARLSWLAWLAVHGNLTMSVQTSQGEEPNLLNAESVGLTWLSDGKASIVIESQVETDSDGHLAAWFDWDYGDPRHRVARMQPLFTKLLTSTACSSELENFRSWLAGLQHKKPPFSEPEEGLKDGTRLRDYQEDAVNEWLKNGGRGYFEMCTGSGKTITALAAAQRLIESAKKNGTPLPPIIVTAPFTILCDQWCSELARMGFPEPHRAYGSRTSYLSDVRAALRYPPSDEPVTIVTTYATFAGDSFQQLLRDFSTQTNPPPIKALWIADEMHHLGSGTRPKLLFQAPDGAERIFTWRIGLSATPEVEGDPDLTNDILEFFGPQCIEYPLSRGIREKVLCSYRYFPRPTFLSREQSQRYFDILRQIHAETNDGEANTKINVDLYRQKRDILRTSDAALSELHAILDLLHIPPTRNLTHALIYCPPGSSRLAGDDEGDESVIDQSEQKLIHSVIEACDSRALEPTAIVANVTPAQREQRLRSFKEGENHVLCAIGCLDEGVDVPSIQTAIILYSVDRRKQFIQRRGRILRGDPLRPTKVAEIYDVILLPHGAGLPEHEARALLDKELRRHREFASLAVNGDEATAIIKKAIDDSVL